MADEKVPAALGANEAVIPVLLRGSKDAWEQREEMRCLRENIATFLMIGTDARSNSEMDKAAKDGVLEAIAILRGLQKKIG